MNPPRELSLRAGRILGITFGLVALLVAVIGVALLLGTVPISPRALFESLWDRRDDLEMTRLILWEIRLPRILLGALTGFTLALGGAVFQALLGNPLADPFILGISSGAALGAVAALALGLSLGFGIPLAAFGGALLSLWALFLLTERGRRSDPTTLILTGVIINVFCSAMLLFLLILASRSQLQSMLFWLYGDLSRGDGTQLLLIAPLVLFSGLVIYGFAPALNLLSLGEESALSLGVAVVPTRWVLLLAVSLMVGLVVALSGLIGFVGLIVPHLSRLVLGPDHRLLLPAAALGGAIFLVLADTLARTILAPTELPVGILCAFFGAPFFLYLLRTKPGSWQRS